LVLSLIERSPLYWKAFRNWLGDVAQLTLSSRMLEFGQIPQVIVVEPAGVDPLPELPWNWRQWCDDELTRLVTIVPSVAAVRLTREGFQLPQDVSPRELAIACLASLEMLRLKRQQLAQRYRQSRYARAAFRDPLTGLPNRRAWQLMVRRSLKAGDLQRTSWLALLDLDGFKQINSEHGHPVADRVLRRVGQTLRRSLRADDFAARIGGDEFGILLQSPETAAEDVLRRVGGQIAESVRGAQLPAVTASVGYTQLVHGPQDTPRRAMRRAAEGLRLAKSGRSPAVRIDLTPIEGPLDL
jgi:diguanylate cyclase (GGDEF)-like protein